MKEYVFKNGWRITKSEGGYLAWFGRQSQGVLFNTYEEAAKYIKKADIKLR